MKVEQNFTNFSALHFRAVNFLRLHGFLIKKCENLEEKKEIVAFGMPLKVISKELDFIATGLYMQTNEQGIWQYHRWLIERMLPIYIVKMIYLPEKSQKLNFHIFYIILSRKCRNLNLSHFEILIDGQIIENANSGQVVNMEKIELSQFWALKITKQNAKEITIKVKNSFKILEIDENNFPSSCIQDINRKRFLLESEFKFKWTEENSSFDLLKMSYCSEEDLKFRSFAMKLIENSMKIVDEIATLEKNNKFVLLEKNFLLDIRFPDNLQENLAKNTENTKKILENLQILYENYKKQGRVFENQIEIYNQRKEVDECILKGKVDKDHLISLYESKGKLDEIKFILAGAGLCVEYLTAGDDLNYGK